MKFAYYPGCTAKGSTREADIATKWLAKRVGIELAELVDAGCCGKRLAQKARQLTAKRWCARAGRHFRFLRRLRSSLAGPGTSVAGRVVRRASR